MTVAVVHPGEMGAAVGAALVNAGQRVIWASEGRSPETKRRAADARLEDVVSIEALVSEADTVLSICPPHAAVGVAEQVARSSHGKNAWTYLDANAIAPTTSSEVSAVMTRAGADYVDGGIIGPPPHRPGTTRLYLSGPNSLQASAVLATSEMEIHVVGDGEFAASALKLSYAAWTKGSQALLLTARAAAARAGVEEALLQEWRTSQPDLPGRYERAELAAAAKGWRWAGEMDEVATMMVSLGLPAGFHRAAATVFRDQS
jgi:3-hydroxyisobutyrate dehydrogenase-like beta-hydroxyacid dehydrogenase